MAIQTKEATLRMGEVTRLAAVRFRRTRLKVTGISQEFTVFPFQKTVRGFVTSPFFDANEVTLSLFDTVPFARIAAKPPDGYAEVDIIYEIRTGADF